MGVYYKSFAIRASNNAIANMKLLQSDPNILETIGSEIEEKNETTNQMNKTNKMTTTTKKIMARINLTQIPEHTH